MIDLVEIGIEDLKEYIEVAYEGDDELMEKYHIKENITFKEAVDITWMIISETNSQVPMKHFGVLCDGEKVGYISVFENNLYSFGVNVKHRNGEVLKEFWDKITQQISSGFITMLYKNNTRAIKFLKRNGMVEIDPDEWDSHDIVTLLKIN